MPKIRVRVFPNSREEKVERGRVWRVWVREPPVGGRANGAVVRILKKFFKNVRIVKGFRSRVKVVEVEE